ncbi:MAG: SO_0444 family Cu/Zn efflux transporter [Candidatus Omnitrophica bacterium]|nr:SO_0444 family Cu/Zn efflux transporter [Candidatus Omnitrophota bacterium]
MDNIIKQLLWETWAMLVMAGPYILFGFLMAGLIHTFISPAKIVSLLGRKNWKSVLTASICGIPLPLCSCSVLPTAAALRQKGASRGATTSFLISTPETGVDSIALTYGIMDLTMAILRPLSAFITAFISGIFVNLWGEQKGNDQEEAHQSKEKACCSSKNANSKDSGKVRPESKQAWWKKTLHYSFFELSDDLSHWLALGIVLSGILSACLPDTVFDGWAGQGVSSLLFMLAISMPMYICASGSTPIAAVMITKGLSPGAALVFLLAGPATNIGSIPILLKILGKRSTIIYLLTIIAISLLIGFGVNLYYSSYLLSPSMGIDSGSEKMGGPISILSAVVLLFLLIKGIIMRPVPAEWKNLNDLLERYSGFRLSWLKIIVFSAILLIFSFLSSFL